MGGPSSSGKSVSYDYATSAKEANSLGHKATPKEWFNKIKGELAHAIERYTGSGYYSINKFLRGLTDASKLNAGQHETIQNIKQALGMARLEHSITVFRGAGIEALGKNFDPSHPEKLIGAKITDKGFMSTSLVSHTAFHNDVTFELRAPKGANGAFVKPISQHTSENEVLFNAGTSMKVTDIQKTGFGTYKVYADILKK